MTNQPDINVIEKRAAEALADALPLALFDQILSEDIPLLIARILELEAAGDELADCVQFPLSYQVSVQFARVARWRSLREQS